MPRTVRSRVLRASLVLLAVLASVPAAIIVWLWSADVWFSYHSPIADGLPGIWDEDRPEFRRRVHQQFPIGTSAEDARRAFLDQGFEENGLVTLGGLSTEDDEIGRLRAAATRLSLERGDFVCRTLFSVGWTADAVGRIASIAANFDYYCL